jgi:hypothetical protein
MTSRSSPASRSSPIRTSDSPPLALLVGLGFMLNSFGTAGVGWSMRDLRQVASSSA